MQKTRLRRYYTVFIYLSILFFIIYLIRQNFLSFSAVRFNPWLLGTSLLFLWSGFFVSTLSWKKALAVHNIKIGWKEACYTHGTAVLGKYIPGKIWVIVGRAAGTAHNNQELRTSALASLREQLLYLFLGLLISTVPVLMLYPAGYVKILLFVTLLLLGLMLFVPGVHRFGTRMVQRLFKKEIQLPMISAVHTFQMGKVILLYWCCWMVAFYLFLRALSPSVIWIQVFAFPLSVCYGVMALIFPGGLGIREGIMTGFLVLTGMSPETAALISLVNRFWYITGELFIFFLALRFRPAKI